MPVETTLTSRELNQDVSKAKRMADDGPVIVTDRGRPAYVMLSYDEYRRITNRRISLAEALAADDDIDFDPPRLPDRIFRPVDFEE